MQITKPPRPPMSEFEPVSAENITRNKSSGIYYLRAKINGRVVRRSLRTTKLKTAKVKRNELLKKLRAGAGISRNSKRSPTQGEACAMVLAYYAELPSYKAKPSSLAYRVQMVDWLLNTLPDKPVTAWTTAAIKAWWNSAAVTRYSATRKNNLLGTFRQMAKMLIRAGHILEDPSEGLSRLTVPPAKVSVPSSEDFKRIIEHISGSSLENSHYVEFLAYSGSRHGEAREVQWCDVGKDSIVITGGELGTKNHECRTIPIIPPMRDLLDRIRQDGSEGKLFSMKSPRGALNRACEHLDIDHIRLHDLRHLFATVCIESGVDIPTVSRWLGHKDGGALAMRVYGHIRDEHSQTQAAKVDF